MNNALPIWAITLLATFLAVIVVVGVMAAVVVVINNTRRKGRRTQRLAIPESILRRSARPQQEKKVNLHTPLFVHPLALALSIVH